MSREKEIIFSTKTDEYIFSPAVEKATILYICSRLVRVKDRQKEEKNFSMERCVVRW